MNTVRKLLKQFIIFYTVILAGAGGKGKAIQTHYQAKALETTVLSPCLIFIAFKEISAYA